MTFYTVAKDASSCEKLFRQTELLAFFVKIAYYFDIRRRERSIFDTISELMIGESLACPSKIENHL